MSKHTPGPWSLVRGGYVGIRQTVNASIGVVAILAEHDIGSAEWEQDDENANLIASAPDLLAACEAAVGVFDTFGVLATTPVWMEARQAALAKLRAAIAKARKEPAP